MHWSFFESFQMKASRAPSRTACRQVSSSSETVTACLVRSLASDRSLCAATRSCWTPARVRLVWSSCPLVWSSCPLVWSSCPLVWSRSDRVTVSCTLTRRGRLDRVQRDARLDQQASQRADGGEQHDHGGRGRQRARLG